MGVVTDNVPAAATSQDVKVTADPISAIANSVGTVFSSVFGFLKSGNDVTIAQTKVENTKQLLLIEKSKNETAITLAQIDLLEKKLDLELSELNNQKELAKQKQTGSIFTILFVLVFLAIMTFLILKFAFPKPEKAQTVILQD